MYTNNCTQGLHRCVQVGCLKISDGKMRFTAATAAKLQRELADIHPFTHTYCHIITRIGANSFVGSPQYVYVRLHRRIPCYNDHVLLFILYNG